MATPQLQPTLRSGQSAFTWQGSAQSEHGDSSSLTYSTTKRVFTLGIIFNFFGIYIPSRSWWKHSAINYVSHGLSKRSFAHISTETRPLKCEPKENVSQHCEKGAVAFSHKATGGCWTSIVSIFSTHMSVPWHWPRLGQNSVHFLQVVQN